MNKSQALTLIDQTILDFQKFVLATQEIYYKGDAQRALEIGAQLHRMKHLIESQNKEEVINEHR